MSRSPLELQERLQSAYSSEAEWRDFAASAGFSRLRDILNSQIRSRESETARKPIQGMDGAFNVAFLQGEISGLLLASRMPELMLETSRELIEQLRGQIEFEETRANA